MYQTADHVHRGSVGKKKNPAICAVYCLVAESSRFRLASEESERERVHWQSRRLIIDGSVALVMRERSLLV